MKIDYAHLGYWLGDQRSLSVLLFAEQEMAGKMLSGDEEESFHRLITVSDGVATIAVKGSLTSRDSYWNQFFGVTSYNEIRNAIVTAVEDEDVTEIMLDVDSGGGDAKGVSELADFIKLAKTHKRITAYVSGSAFSAAYWIASAANKIVGPMMAEVGSIGVIAMLPDYSKAYAKQGIKIHVIRAGKYKALGNGYEKLTLAAQNILQAKLDKMYGFFLDAISENRGIPRDKVQSQVGEGLTFFAEEGVDNGLMDEIVSFDEIYSRLVKSANQSTGRMTLSEDDVAMKKALKMTAEAIAAKAAGASDEEVKALMAEAPAEEASGDGVVPTEAEAAEAEAAAEEDDTAAAEAAALEKAASADAVDQTLVTYLKDEAKTLRADNGALVVANVSLTTQLDAAKAGEAALKGAVSTFVEQMSISMGMSVPDMTTMDSSNLAALYASTRTKFTETFKVGAVAKVEDGEAEAAEGAALTPAEKAAIRANKAK